MMKIPMATAKKRLAIVWFFGFTILFLLLFAQTIWGRYGDKVEEAWSWFLPSVMPTLSLMIDVFVADALKMSREAQHVDKFLYRLSLFLSLLYLLTITGTIVLQPYSELWPIELMQKSHLWLGPLQGLVAGTLVFFFRQRGSEERSN